MERTDITEKVKQVVVSVLKHNNFEMTDTLTAKEVTGWDSLTHMAIVTAVEEQFKIRFKLKELNKLANMGDLINLIQSKL